MKKFLFVAILLVLVSFSIQCRQAGQTDGNLTDDLGRPILVKNVPERIISLAPSNTELLFALGLGNKVVAVDDFSDFPEQAAKLQHVGSAFPAFSIETITSLKPDLCVAFGYELPDYVTKLQSLGMQVIVFAPKDIDGIIADIELLGSITGTDTKAQRLVADIKSRLNAIEAKMRGASKPRVFWQFDSTDPAKPWTAGPGSFNDILIGLAGGDNVGSVGPTSSWQMNSEAIIKADPQIIIAGDFKFGATIESIASRQGWNSITAVKNKAIYPIPDPNITDRPGPRIIDGVELIAKLIHPELFK